MNSSKYGIDELRFKSLKSLSFKDSGDVKSYIKSENIKRISLKLPDLSGHFRNVVLPASAETIDTIAGKGVGFDASSVGIQPVEKADMVLKPLWHKGFTDIFEDTLAFISAAYEAESKKPTPIDPQHTIVAALEYAKKQNICDEALFAPEYEFYLFDKLNFSGNPLQKDPAPGFGYNAVPLYASETGRFVQNSYHMSSPGDKGYLFRNILSEICENMGIPVRYHHHEVGTGQHELEVRLTPLEKAADHFMLIKYFSHILADMMNVNVTFMPKPFAGYPGSGLHCHQTILKNGKNLFYDKNGYSGLSETALSYIAGLLSNGNALLGITNASVNSYRRLIPGFEAPVMAFFSPANRSAAIRIPSYAKNEKDQRIEFRTPDAMTNPYLMLSAQFLAGIDGIEKKLNPREMGFGPVETNIFNWDKEKLKTLKPLPASLGESLNHLENEHEFLSKNGVFPLPLLKSWIKNKRKEVEVFAGIPNPAEVMMYWDK